MSDTKAQTPSEPTMEEILASIRRIISENDEEHETKKRSEADIPAQLAQSPAKDSGGLNVLDLTEMVTEDGAVVSLSNTGEQEKIIEGEARQETIAAVPDTQPEDIQPDVTESDVGESDDTEPADEGEASDAHAEKAEMTMDNSREDSVEFAPSSPSPTATSTTSAASAPSPSGNDGLVSAATAAAATATFAQLARSLAQEPSVSGSMPLGSGRTLEDLVKEMIRPMLKDWLDRNLPQIVEHAVRRELDRMTRRAEDI